MKAIRTILACLRKADNTYNLINHGDKIVIGLSGGKDSVVLTYALNLYSKFSHTQFEIQPIILDLGFDGFDPTPMSDFCKSLGLELKVIDCKDVYKILKIQQKDAHHLPCSICSKMKKAAINKAANELGFNKVAFAHHADDAIETLLMNEIYGARFATFSPKMFLERAGITFIRPLILCKEKDIKSLVNEENLPVSPSHCPADKITKREEIKKVLNEIYKQFPESKENFLTMLSNYTKQDLWGDEISYQITQEGLTIKPVISRDDAIIENSIRSKVFMQELHFDYDGEFDLQKDLSSKSYLICLNSTPIGTIRYRLTEKGFKLERFAFLKEYRHNGYGKKVLNFFTNKIGEEHNPCTIYLHALLHAKNFYLSCGFSEEGDIFLEGGKEHIYMFKKY